MNSFTEAPRNSEFVLVVMFMNLEDGTGEIKNHCVGLNLITFFIDKRYMTEVADQFRFYKAKIP